MDTAWPGCTLPIARGGTNSRARSSLPSGTIVAIKLSGSTLAPSRAARAAMRPPDGSAHGHGAARLELDQPLLDVCEGLMQVAQSLACCCWQLLNGNTSGHEFRALTSQFAVCLLQRQPLLEFSHLA